MRNLIHGLVAASLLAMLPIAAQAGVFVSVAIAPPALPVYYQPPIPGPGYIWTPGYWAWDDGYYWVPGTWVIAPVGLLWTPGYWGWVDGAYFWHDGYWGPHVGFYGGVNYGFGYGGEGFVGGEWRGDHLYYNRAVTNISNTRITTVYNRTVVNSGPVSHVSYNGGAGGIAARPGTAELAAEHERHQAPLQVQTEHRTMAAHDNAMRASVNGGRPSIAATPRAGVFTGRGVVAASGAGSAPRGAGNRGESTRYAQERGGRSPSEQTRGGSFPQPAHGNSFEAPRGASGQPRSFQPQPQRAQPQPQRVQPQPQRVQPQPQRVQPQPQRVQPQPQRVQPQSRGNEPRGNPQPEQRPQPEERPQRDDRPQQHQARAFEARPQQLMSRAQARPQWMAPQTRTAQAQWMAPQTRMARPQWMAPQTRMAQAPQRQEPPARGGEPRGDHRG